MDKTKDSFYSRSCLCYSLRGVLESNSAGVAPFSHYIGTCVRGIYPATMLREQRMKIVIEVVEMRNENFGRSN